MTFRLIDLQIKIATLAAEARLIRDKEQLMKHKAFRSTYKAIASERGIDLKEAPEELRDECQCRSQPNYEYQLKSGTPPFLALDDIERVTRKTIKRWLRAGLTKEQILALPGVVGGLAYTAKLNDLHRHRVSIVRPEARYSNLAYAFLRGKAYSRTEGRAFNLPDWDKVQKIAERFCEDDKRAVAQRFEQWRQEAHSLIKGNQLMRALKSAA